MAALETILKQLQEQGIQIKAEGGNLKVTLAGKMSEPIESLLTELRERKQEFLESLTASKPLPDVLELVPLFSGQHTIEYSERLRVRIQEGLIKRDAERAAADDILNGKPILRAMYTAAWLWENGVFPTGRGHQAWVWIHAHPQHGIAIRNAENAIDQIGSTGDRLALQKACDIWVTAWRAAIEDWRARG